MQNLCILQREMVTSLWRNRSLIITQGKREVSTLSRLGHGHRLVILQSLADARDLRFGLLKPFWL